MTIPATNDGDPHIAVVRHGALAFFLLAPWQTGFATGPVVPLEIHQPDRAAMDAQAAAMLGLGRPAERPPAISTLHDDARRIRLSPLTTDGLGAGGSALDEERMPPN